MEATTSTLEFYRLDQSDPPLAYFRGPGGKEGGNRRPISIAAPIYDPELQKIARETPLGTQVRHTIETDWDDDALPSAVTAFEPVSAQAPLTMAA